MPSHCSYLCNCQQGERLGSGMLRFALRATIAVSQEFLRAQLGTFPSTCPCASQVCQGKNEPPAWDQEGLGQQGKVLQWTGGEDVLQPP